MIIQSQLTKCLDGFILTTTMADNHPSASDLPQEIGGEIPVIEQAELTIAEHEARILALPNVVGIGFGEKEGEPTKRVLQVFVSKKFPAAQLRSQQVAPEAIGDFEVDVIEVGTIVAQFEGLKDRVRPISGGYSIGHPDITAGTVGYAVYDLQPGAKTDPPAHGIGVPTRYYVLSNNHVLANSNNARVGDPIVQPGAFDGGRIPNDTIAVLRRWVPIQFDPPLARERHNNYVDAAIAEIDPGDITRYVMWQGHLMGWRPRRYVIPGAIVQKTGRTTAYTTGRIISVAATIDVNYGGGRVARFKDQIITTGMSAGGDSGSGVQTLDGIVIGLLFAGSSTVSVLNHIEHVRSLLRVEVIEHVRQLPSLDIMDTQSVRKLLGNGGMQPTDLPEQVRRIVQEIDEQRRHQELAAQAKPII